MCLVAIIAWLKEKGDEEMSAENPRMILVANVAKEHVLKFHVPTIKMLKEAGWYVDVACSGDEEVPYCDHQYHMSYKRNPFTLKTFKGIKELKEIINNGNYDVVYCHTPVGGMVGRLASINAGKHGTKVVYFAHGFHFYKGAPLINWFLYYPVEKVLSRYTDAIITINNEDCTLAKNKFHNCNVYQLDGIGVDLSKFDVSNKEVIRRKYRENFDIPQNATVLVYLAELLPNKNQTFLMEVLKKVLEKKEDVYLLLAGIDHSNGEFEKYSERIGVSEHIRFLGWRDDVGNLYATSDICTATSIREGFGLNLVEAMACDIPVIATRNRGHETIIKNNQNGFLIDIGDVNSFADAILKLANDKMLYEQFVKTAKVNKDKYSSTTILVMLKKILDCYV